MTRFYQVVGRGAWMVDYPHGDTKSHRPGDVFEANESNASVERGLRVGRLRLMEPREESALRAAAAAQLAPATEPATKSLPVPAPKK